MKKKVVTSLCILLIIVCGVFWSLLYEEQLPEPSQESLNYITSELDGLNLEESIEKIRKDKKSFDLFSKMGRADDLYSERTQIPQSEEYYKKNYSILSPAEYQQAFENMINSLSFNQDLFYNSSFINLIVDEMPSKQQPVINIKKITYMDGSEEIIDEKQTKALRLDNNKTVKNLTAAVTYNYITELGTYHLSTDTPKITQPNFTLRLAKKDKNFLSYTLDGDLNIAGEDIADKNGNILSASACVKGGVDFANKMSRYIDGIVKASESHNKNKDELIHRVAAYYERFEQETDAPMTYRVACLFHGTPATVTIYEVKSTEKEKRNIVITPKYLKSYPVVKDPKTEIFYIIDQNGNEILNNGNAKPYILNTNYFFTKTIETRTNDDGDEYEVSHYQLHQLDVKNKKANRVTEMNSVFSLSDDAFVIAKDNEILLFNTENEKPILFSGENLIINILDFSDEQSRFFYYRDKQGYHIINDKGVQLLPAAEYKIKNGGNNTIIFGPSIFIEDKMDTSDKKFYFLNSEGDIFLTVIGYDKVEEFRDNMIHVERNKLHGFIDNTGYEVIPLHYENVRNFDNGYALVKKDNHWGVINKQGDIIIPFKYSSHNSLSSVNGLMSYHIDGKDYTMEELLKENAVKTEKYSNNE
ncbi:WG repeat-containing protein [Providencia manganoxydans]|uniref:WG repeat-containing protein n=1 Tax=Providencia manganoxydans TaxID=2923283 RepID=UPI0034E4AA78